MEFINELIELKNSDTYIHSTNRYFYTGCLNRYDVLLSTLHPSIPFKTNASLISKLHNVYKHNITKDDNFDQITLNHYDGSHPEILQIQKYLENELSKEIYFALLHGSFATDDNISFSDFDGMIILKDEVFNDVKRLKRTSQLLSKSCSLMIKLDPLQHHGWFIFSESDCYNWQETFFPKDIILNSKILLSKENHINIRFNFDDSKAKENLIRLIHAIQIKITSGNLPTELYSLKSQLSEFMLLPSLFLQYNNKRGMYKKYSFAEASKYFHRVDYSIMDEISDIRKKWPYKTSSFNLDSLTLVSPGIKKKQKELSFSIPNELSAKLTPEFYNRMFTLTEKVKELIK